MNIKKYLILTGLFFSLQGSCHLPRALNYSILRCHEHLRTIQKVAPDELIIDQQSHYAAHLSQLYDLYYSIKSKGYWSVSDQKSFESILVSFTNVSDVQYYKRVINDYNKKQLQSLPYLYQLKILIAALTKISIACACLGVAYYYKKEIKDTGLRLKNFSTDFIQTLKNTYDLYKKPSPMIRYNPDLIPAPMSAEESIKSSYYVIKSAVYTLREESIKTMNSYEKQELKKEIMQHARNSTLPHDVMKEWSTINTYEMLIPNKTYIPYNNKKASPIAKAYFQYLFLSVANPICSIYEIVDHNMPYFSSAKKIIKLFAYASTIPLSFSIYKNIKNSLSAKHAKLPQIRNTLYTMQRLFINARHKTMLPAQKGMLYHYAWCIGQESKKHLSHTEYKKFMNDVYCLCTDRYKIKQKKSLLKLMLNSYEFLH